MDEFRSLALTCRSDGMTADQTAEALLFNGASPIDAIKALRDAFVVRPGETKAAAHPHLSQEQQDAAEELWDEQRTR
jgi:hypothetical protein